MHGWGLDSQYPVRAVGPDLVVDSACVDGFDGGLVFRFEHDSVVEVVRDGSQVLGTEGLRRIAHLLMRTNAGLVDRGGDDGKADVTGAKGTGQELLAQLRNCTSMGRSFVATFLAVTGQLCKRVCRLVCRSVCWSITFSFLASLGAVAAY